MPRKGRSITGGPFMQESALDKDEQQCKKVGFRLS